MNEGLAAFSPSLCLGAWRRRRRREDPGCDWRSRTARCYGHSRGWADLGACVSADGRLLSAAGSGERGLQALPQAAGPCRYRLGQVTALRQRCSAFSPAPRDGSSCSAPAALRERLRGRGSRPAGGERGGGGQVGVLLGAAPPRATPQRAGTAGRSASQNHAPDWIRMLLQMHLELPPYGRYRRGKDLASPACCSRLENAAWLPLRAM